MRPTSRSAAARNQAGRERREGIFEQLDQGPLLRLGKRQPGETIRDRPHLPLDPAALRGQDQLLHSPDAPLQQSPRFQPIDDAGHVEGVAVQPGGDVAHRQRRTE